MSRKTGGEQCAVRQRQSSKSEECLPPVILRSGSDEGSVSPAAGDWDGKRSFAALRMTRRENARDDEDGGIPGMTRRENARDDEDGGCPG